MDFAKDIPPSHYVKELFNGSNDLDSRNGDPGSRDLGIAVFIHRRLQQIVKGLSCSG